MESLHYAIALSGGIGTGKSTVASLLRLYGFEVIDADFIAHRLLKEKQKEVVDLFGEGILKEGEIDRKSLGARVFGDPKERARLEALLHPPIRQEILQKAQKLEAKAFPYFIDIPLFFEKRDDYPMVNQTLLIYAPRKLQVERIKKRDSLSMEEIEARLGAQMDIKEKVPMAHYILSNEGNLNDLTQEVERLIETIKKDFHV